MRKSNSIVVTDRPPEVTIPGITMSGRESLLIEKEGAVRISQSLMGSQASDEEIEVRGFRNAAGKLAPDETTFYGNTTGRVEVTQNE